MLQDKKIRELDNILVINPNNLAIKFIYWRMLQNNYRGLHLLQHNRWTFEKFRAIIIAIFHSQDNNGYVRIPRGDEGKFHLGDYSQYLELIKKFQEEYKKSTNKEEGTANTIKKNLFPDLARMGVIDRYKINNNQERTILKPYVKDSVDLIKFKDYLNLNEKTLNDNHFLRQIYNNFSKNIYNDLPLLLFELISDENLKGKIDEYEFLFFITWYDNFYLEYKIDKDQIKELILSWRNLSLSARNTVINFIRNWADREKWINFKKDQKRDFYNWKNQTQEIMQHIKDSEIFSLNINATQFEIFFKKQDEQIKRYRSETPKLEYLEKHNMKKIKGFEFDHIVPFSWSTTFEQALKICSWKNLIYIDAKNHAIKTQSNNIYVYLNSRKEINYLYLESENKKDFLFLKLNKDVYFNMNLFQELKEYNISLNKFVSEHI